MKHIKARSRFCIILFCAYMVSHVANASSVTFAARGGWSNVSLPKNLESAIWNCPAWITADGAILTADRNESLYSRDGSARVSYRYRVWITEVYYQGGKKIDKSHWETYSDSMTFLVSQDGAPLELMYDTDALTWNCDGGSFNIIVDTWASWTASSTNDWITLSTKSGIGASALMVTVAQNVGQPRESVVSIGANIASKDDILYKENGYVIIRAASVPTFHSNTWQYFKGRLYVPDASVEAYKADQYITFDDRVLPLSQFATDFPDE